MAGERADDRRLDAERVRDICYALEQVEGRISGLSSARSARLTELLDRAPAPAELEREQHPFEHGHPAQAFDVLAIEHSRARPAKNAVRRHMHSVSGPRVARASHTPSSQSRLGVASVPQ